LVGFVRLIFCVVFYNEYVSYTIQRRSDDQV
jgi:hypothetical protein